MSSYDRFFDSMEDLGFLGHIYEALPEDFTAVFEIARVLEDERHPLTERLAPALRLRAPGRARREEHIAPDTEPVLLPAEEYEAGLIRHPMHLPRIYAGQWLLPDEVFDRRLANRELWVPYAREPRLFPVDPGADDFAPDHRKQKLYVLLDTSSSMALHHRITLAKGVVYHFLKRNMKELGYISFRTFDTRLGELRTARDRAGFRALISFVMRLRTLGNGTAMARAITQAAEDIRALPELAGAEILVVTDGACALDEAVMRALLGDAICINTIKIGRSQLVASRSLIRDRLFEEDTEQHRIVGDLQKKADELRRRRDVTASPARRKQLDDSLAAMERELNRQVNAMTEEIVVGYGHELERLSDLFIRVDDIDICETMALCEEALDELTAVTETLLEQLALLVTPEALRRLALVGDHLVFLERSVRDEGARRRIASLQALVMQGLTDILREHGLGGSAAGALAGGGLPPFSAEDRHDLEFLLSFSPQLRTGLWRQIVRQLLARLRALLAKG